MNIKLQKEEKRKKGLDISPAQPRLSSPDEYLALFGRVSAKEELAQEPRSRREEEAQKKASRQDAKTQRKHKKARDIGPAVPVFV